MGERGQKVWEGYNISRNIRPIKKKSYMWNIFKSYLMVSKSDTPYPLWGEGQIWNSKWNLQLLFADLDSTEQNTLILTINIFCIFLDGTAIATKCNNLLSEASGLDPPEILENLSEQICLRLAHCQEKGCGKFEDLIAESASKSAQWKAWERRGLTLNKNPKWNRKLNINMPSLRFKKMVLYIEFRSLITLS